MKWNMLKSVLENAVTWKHKSTVTCNPITLILFSFFLLLVYAYIVCYALLLVDPKRIWQTPHKKLELSWKHKFSSKLVLLVKTVLYIFLSCHWHVTTQRWL